MKLESTWIVLDVRLQGGFSLVLQSYNMIVLFKLKMKYNLMKYVKVSKYSNQIKSDFIVMNNAFKSEVGLNGVKSFCPKVYAKFILQNLF